MLLTSSQVSVAVSSGVVILCTLALFLSGYAIQQRTLRDLRRSIREPKPEPPKIFLPDRFKKMTTELPDGTVVILDDDEEANTLENSIGSSRGGQGTDEQMQQQQVVVEVKPSISISEDERNQQQQVLTGGESHEMEKQSTERSADHGVSEEIPVAEQNTKAPSKPKKPEKSQKPISKAERRRLIKEELKRLSYNDKPVYYQRRLY